MKTSHIGKLIEYDNQIRGIISKQSDGAVWYKSLMINENAKGYSGCPLSYLLRGFFVLVRKNDNDITEKWNDFL